METIALRAHYDGEQIVLDESFELKPNTPLLVLVLPEQLKDQEIADWLGLSLHGLSTAYGEEEPGYLVEGQEFILEEADEFEKEVAALSSSEKFMSFIRKRSQEPGVVALDSIEESLK